MARPLREELFFAASLNISTINRAIILIFKAKLPYLSLSFALKIQI